MFSLTQVTPVGGDCCAGYKVNLDKEYTVSEFIKSVLENRKMNGATLKSKTRGLRLNTDMEKS